MRPPGPPIAMAISSARALGAHWSTTSAPKPPVISRTVATASAPSAADDLVGAELARQLLAGLRARDRDDGRAHRLAELDGVRAEPADADDDELLTRREPRDAPKTVDRRRDGIGEHRERLGRDRAGRPDERLGRPDDVLGEGPVEVDAHSPDMRADVRPARGRPRVVGRGADVVERDLVVHVEPSTPSPRASTRPAASWPGTIGNEHRRAEARRPGGNGPSRRRRRPRCGTRTSPGPGSGIGPLRDPERLAHTRQLHDPHRPASRPPDVRPPAIAAGPHHSSSEDVSRSRKRTSPGSMTCSCSIARSSSSTAA